ncbi:MAG: serine/threonine-protein kinase [Deltaproteobacteria bacterium]|nr:serine/threonine-protein kinase [Deltaproteobacteria bacterium]
MAEIAQASAPTGPSQGEYQTIQELAAGGMGSVFLARTIRGPHTGQLVAIKRMHPHLERNPQFSASFFDEAFITAGLQHPNVVDILDWGTDKEGRYIALEFVAGESILTLLKAARAHGQHIPLDVVIYMIARTAEALHAAHELRNERGELRHLVHRDVTPSNVLVSRDGVVKLIDFGVAKARERLQQATVTNTLKGKFGYMSPEQARGVRNLDRRSDVWSLGVMLWECLASKRLYKSESELEILRMVTEDPTPSVRSVRPEVPVAIDTFLGGVFAKNRDDRIGSCAEFADFLWAVYREEGYRANDQTLATYFRQMLPERSADLDRLFAGEDLQLQRTQSGPASGSFDGSSQHSGVLSLDPRPSSMSVDYQLQPDDHARIFSQTASDQSPPKKSSRGLALGIAAGIFALCSLGVLGVVVSRGSGSSSTSTPQVSGTSGSTLAAQNTATQPTPTPTTVPAAQPPVAVPATVQALSGVEPSSGSQGSTRGTTRTTSQRRGNTQVAGNPTGISLEETRNRMLLPTANPATVQPAPEPRPTQRPTTQPTVERTPSTTPEPPRATPTTPTVTAPTPPAGTGNGGLNQLRTW